MLLYVLIYHRRLVIHNIIARDVLKYLMFPIHCDDGNSWQANENEEIIEHNELIECEKGMFNAFQGLKSYKKS